MAGARRRSASDPRQWWLESLLTGAVVLILVVAFVRPWGDAPADGATGEANLAEVAARPHEADDPDRGQEPGARPARARPAGGEPDTDAGRREDTDTAAVDVENGSGTFVVAAGTSESPATAGQARSYVVEVEHGIGVDPEEFADLVEAALYDRRSWGSEVPLRRVDEEPADFRVTLATTGTVDRLCLPLRTNGIFSCWDGERALLNLKRWLGGAESFADDLDAYRLYMVNHEVGHGLGHGHVGCPAAGSPAPIMMQQTKTTGACSPNPWPFPER